MEEVKTTKEMLDDQIRETLDDLEMARFSNEESVKPMLEKLKVLHTQQLEIQKLEQQATQKRQELELELQKFENDTAIKIRELELKEKEAKNNQANEEQKLKEQKKSNVTNAVLGGCWYSGDFALFQEVYAVRRDWELHQQDWTGCRRTVQPVS